MNSPVVPSSHLVVFPHIRVQNANAISSPLTHGFPSITAFMGLMWALERRAHAAGLADVFFNAVGVVCHSYQEQVTDTGFTKTFNLTRNPIDKSGKTAPIVEEGRIHLDVSILFAVSADGWQDEAVQQKDIAALFDLLQTMRVAGGSVLPSVGTAAARFKPWCLALADTEKAMKTFEVKRYQLLPGFALIEREELLTERLTHLRQTDPEATALDAWLSLSRVNWHYGEAGGEWVHDRDNGWVVPIPVGYGALGVPCPPGTVKGARDETVPFQAVESLFSVGQWIAPSRVKTPQDLLWYASSCTETGVYRCSNFYRAPKSRA
ncbi:MAG: type I-F CRISPR-associated protein Csy2 [Acetobacter cibinongensis]